MTLNEHADQIPTAHTRPPLGISHVWIALVRLVVTGGAVAAAAFSARHVRLYSTALIATGGHTTMLPPDRRQEPA